MTRTLLALALALTTLSPALALAQGNGHDDIRVEEFTDADTVTGSIAGPDGGLIDVHRRGVRTSLIRPRAHYMPELLRSVENL
jgi:hypothetical protein